MVSSGLRRNFMKACGRFRGFAGGLTRGGYKGMLLASIVRILLMEWFCAGILLRVGRFVWRRATINYINSILFASGIRGDDYPATDSGSRLARYGHALSAR